MTHWMKEFFGPQKPIIGMCHFRPLPGDPDYNATLGAEYVIEQARADLGALQRGGVDAVMFSNEFSIPYQLKVEPIAPIAMARVIGELRSEIHVPFGVDVLWDPAATVELAVAVGADFAREVFSGVYSSDFGMWNTNSGNAVRLRNRLGASRLRLLYNIVPEAATYLGSRDIASIARSTEFNARPDAFCVSGLLAGSATDAATLRKVKGAVEHTPVLANTGVRRETVTAQLAIADGAVVGTTFKRDGMIWNEVDEHRVRDFMCVAREVAVAA